MRALATPLRKRLETAVLAARREAESASRAVIDGLGVFADRRPEHLNAHQTGLRNGLRAKWRQLGGDRELLVAECAYEQWHRLLFARFLAENDLLLHPQFKASVTLADCEELASGLGEPDGWAVAARFAAEILPGIFRLDDPCVRLRLAPEGRHSLERILDGLPTEVFASDDALGWVYQFWQKDKKDEVNASERKIGGADLGPVTQLFTENYMVRFLLENSLGAWWAARHPDSPLVKGFEYLRFDDAGGPAAGSFDGWPGSVAEVTVMDPCCGSGHFLVEALSMLWQMRVEEEGLSPVEAQDAVLRDNLFGLELDARCVQIAMFAVALQAWKAGGGWRQLPVPNVACSGIPVKAPVEEWKALAGGDQRLENALVRLHILFRHADTLGSLIDPMRASEITDPTGLQASFDDADWGEIAPMLERAAWSEAIDPATAVFGAGAAGVARAADYLTRAFSLVATNVPYLVRQRHDERLSSELERFGRSAGSDLATAFLVRAGRMVPQGTVASVSPASWLTRNTYGEFRRGLLAARGPSIVSWLGGRAFTSITGEVVKVVLVVLGGGNSDYFAGIDVREAALEDKPRALKSFPLIELTHRGVLNNSQTNPDARVVPVDLGAARLLQEFVDVRQGMTTGDVVRFVLSFWELPLLSEIWVRFQEAPDGRGEGGRASALLWENGVGVLERFSQDRQQATNWRGRAVWGCSGVLISQVTISAAHYRGDKYPDSAIALIPRNALDLPALWACASSSEYRSAVRAIDESLGVPPSTLGKVPFDVDRWRNVAEDAGALPEPWSDDPTQWLFEGRPEVSTAPLQVSVGRLIGYRWPEQGETDDLSPLADVDGIVCLPSVAGEAPAAERVQHVLSAAFGEAWAPSRMKELLEEAGSKKNLADWLRDEFFKHHCALFGNRPFVWHVWDGQRDGFSALVNYHRLDRKMLEKLTYTYLGQDWVERQRAEARAEVAGAEARLSAALALQRKLEAIIYGEKPYDIYVRWKELHQQAVGWEPDLNDGVRLNVRPFVEAGVLRSPFNIHWKKDRGKNPDGSERHNDIHLSLAEKAEARKRAGRA